LRFERRKSAIEQTLYSYTQAEELSFEREVSRYSRWSNVRQAPVALRDLLFLFYRHPCIDENPRTGVINAYPQIATALEAVVHAIRGLVASGLLHRIAAASSLRRCA
jgi:hypothetical protein